MRSLFLALTLLFSGPAWAGGDGLTQGPFNGGTVANPIVAPSFNATGAAGYQLNGFNGMVMGTDANNPYMAIGKGAGALLGPTALWEFALGYGSLANDVNTTAGENVGLGPLTLNKLTTGTFNAAGGLHAGGNLLTDNNTTTFGNDAGRNFVGANSRTAIGDDAGRSGGRADALMFDTYVGFQAGRGNAGAYLIGGTATNGDVISAIFTSAQLSGSPVTVTSAVTAGQTTAQMATALKNAINASGLVAQGVSAGIDVINTSVVSIDFPGTSATGLSVVLTSSVSGSATETVTATGGSAGQDNIGIGEQSMYFSRATSASFNVGIGKQTLASLTTGATNFAAGHATLPRLTTASRVTAAGALAGQNATTGDGNTLFGYQAGGTLTTGFSNTIIGQNVASTTLTTGAGNIIIGVSSSADATASGSNDTLKIQGGGSTATISATSINGATPAVTIPGTLQIGVAALTLAANEMGLTKITASGSAPGAAGGKFSLVCGTNAGTAKLIISAGTSGTAVTVVDNIGAGVTGC